MESNLRIGGDEGAKEQEPQNVFNPLGWKSGLAERSLFV